MNIREEARKTGGEEMVAKVDFALSVEVAVRKDIAELLERHVKAASDEDGNIDSGKEMLVAVGMAEALSATYAAAAATAFLAADGQNGVAQSEDEMIGRGMASVLGNMRKFFDDRAAKEGGVADLIKNAGKAKTEGK